METCKHCGSLLSAVTWTCVRGKHCPGGERLDKYRPGDVVGGYCAAAVDKAIAASNRAGRRISGKEANAIHALLKGRY